MYKFPCAFILVYVYMLLVNKVDRAFQERRDGVIESCLYVNYVTSDSFRRYTIIAENAVAIGRQRTVLTERTSFNRIVSFTEQSPYISRESYIGHAHLCVCLCVCPEPHTYTTARTRM